MPELATVYDYLKTYSAELGQRIVESYPPLQSPSDPISPLFARLKRKPLAAQRLAIQGTVNYLKGHRAAKIVAEMGTGKTYMSLATCFVHADHKPFTSLVMCPPHLTMKWAREIFLTIPNSRVFLIEDMRNAGDPKKPHGVNEVVITKDGTTVKRQGFHCSLSDLRRLGSKEWKRRFPANCHFVMSKEKGKLSYFWRHATGTAQSGPSLGSMVNADTGQPVNLSNGSQLTRADLLTTKHEELTQRLKGGTTLYSPLWQADRGKIQRIAPLEYMGRYMKGWFDYSIADEMHQLTEDTAQGNGLGVLARVSKRIIGLTGTLLGGYADNAFYLLYRMDAPQMARAGYEYGGEGRRMFQSNYGVVEEIRKHQESTNACSKASKDSISIKRRPGCSPLLFGQFFMESTAFVSLEDISDNLPSYTEIPIAVEMDSDLAAAYTEIQNAIRHALTVYPRNASLTSMMLNTLLAYPDHPFGFDPLQAKVRDTQNGGHLLVHICDPDDLDQAQTFAKEQVLLDDIRKEIAEGRRVQVYATFTGEHDVNLRLRTVLERAGLRVAVLRSTVPTDAREQWYAARLKEGVQVVICHPKLVETGLDLLDFPTIYFYETGYSLHTLRQASRRSWRIGQKHPVRVKFLFYEETMQEKMVKLMGRKMLVALMMEGKFTGEGLDGMDDDNDMMTSLVKDLLTEGGVGDSATAIWNSLERERSFHVVEPTSEELDVALRQIEQAETAAAGFTTGSTVLSPLSGFLDFGGDDSEDEEAALIAAVPFPVQATYTSAGQMLLFG